MDCNEVQQERGGKDLLLKICTDVEIDVEIGTGDNPTHILLTNHGAKVGDLVEFDETELGTIDDVNAGRLYVVKTVVDANTFIISDTLTPGAAVTFTNALTDMAIKLYKDIGGLRTNTFAFASDAIENSNRGTNQYRKIVDGAGMRQMSISGDGVYNNSETYLLLEDKTFDNLLVCLAFVDALAGKIYYGCYKITALEGSGAFDGEATFTMSAVSSGEIKRYTLAPDA